MVRNPQGNKEKMESYIRDAIGSHLLPHSLMPAHAVVIGEEVFHGISNMSFGITLARPALMFNTQAILSLFTGDAKLAYNLQTYLLSRDHSNLKSEFQDGNGKKVIDSIEQQPAAQVVLGEHVFLTVGDYYLDAKSG
ncbi:hypothetical protein SESBI_14243 [Sesbania bispinosa]|nr:hypothetical protein SESBI_14243 [Sesbania bispinosa]